MVQSPVVSNDLPPAVKAMQDISITGNVIPMAWFKTLTFENGKPDTNSILILSDIVYWYRPTEERDERSGAVTGYKKKFAEDLLRRSYSDLETYLGISKKQCQESLRRLEEHGVIQRVFRTIDTPSGRVNNVMYIDLHPEKLKALTPKNIPKSFVKTCSYPVTPSVESDGTPYGNQIPQVWNSNSIGVETKLHTYGDQSPHHIKDTNTSPKITLSPESSQNASVPSSASDEREIALQMISIWNEVIPQKAISSVSALLKNQLEAAYHLRLDASLTQWRLICENFKSSKFLMGEAEGVRIKPDLSWLLDANKDHLHNVLTKSKYTFDDRRFTKKVKSIRDLEADILSSKDDLELKTLKRDVLQKVPLCYLGILQFSQFEMDDTSLKVFVPTSYAKDKINEDYYDVIQELVSYRYNRSFEVILERKSLEAILEQKQ